MRIVAIAAALLVLTAAGFAAGRATADRGGPDNATESGTRELTGRLGDAFRVPSVGVYCTVGVEAFRPRFLCSRLAGTRGYDVAFERKRTVVVRVGDPGDVTTFPEER